MIQNLIKQINNHLKVEFDGRDLDPGNSVLLDQHSPGDASLRPVIASELGAFEIANVPTDLKRSEPRSREFKQIFPVDNLNPAGPYVLDQIPTQGSAYCRIIYDHGTTEERSELLLENEGYTLNYPTKSLTFLADIAAADQIVIQYAFIGIFTVKEFEQLFSLNVIAPKRPLVEQWSSLVSAAILTSKNDLLNTYNETDKTEYIVGNTFSGHTISEFSLQEITFQSWAATLSAALHFRVKGNLTFAKVLPPSFGRIESVRSPGKTADPGVNVEVGLG